MKTGTIRRQCWILAAVFSATVPLGAQDANRSDLVSSSRRHQTTGVAAPPLSAIPHAEKKTNRTGALTQLPPLAAGVTEIKFSDFFRQPVGPGGLEITDKLRSLAGRRARVLGYMVKQERPLAHGFLLTPVPITLHEDEYGFCDDLPATVLHVFTATHTPPEVPYTPGVLLLTGPLSVGNREEADHRISTVRLELDAPANEPGQATNRIVEIKVGDKPATNPAPLLWRQP